MRIVCSCIIFHHPGLELHLLEAFPVEVVDLNLVVVHTVVHVIVDLNSGVVRRVVSEVIDINDVAVVIDNIVNLELLQD